MASNLKALEKLAERILFEDTWNKYGSEYMSHPTGEGDEDDTLPPDLPIQALDQMAVQLTVERPPIEDENFEPDGVEELSRAVKIMSLQVPQDQVKNFYIQIKKEIELAIERHNDPDNLSVGKEESEANTAQLESEIDEGKLREMISNIVFEARKPGWGPMRGSTGGSDWGSIKLGSHAPPIEDIEDFEGEPVKDTIKGKHIAKYYDKASPSGVQNASDRLMQNYLRPLMSVRSEDLRDSMDYIKFHFREKATDPPTGAEQAFVSYVLKKVVKDLSHAEEDISNMLLPSVVQHVKEMPDRKFDELIEKAVAEAHSEDKASKDLSDTLREEEPEQYEVLKYLGLAR